MKARDAKADDYMKMFLMPGVLHCAGGPGPDASDWAAAIDRWVENRQGAGSAPRAEGIQRRGDALAAALCLSGSMRSTSGTGSTDQAENFACKN